MPEIKLSELSPAAGSSKKAWRKGRGTGSGNGKTAGRGHKGQWARSGGGVRPGFEGGQTPMHRRLPKRGFNNSRFATTFAIINIDALNSYEDGTVVNMELLCNDGAVSKTLDGLKVLGRGDLQRKLTVQATAFTESAKAKIEAAGGKAEVI